MKKITMKDIAKEAKVSTATVSYILNSVESQSISEDTKEKVMKAAQKLNYIRNLNARTLKSGKSELIGILLPQTAGESYWTPYRYTKAIFHLGKYLNRHGYHLIVVHIDPDSPKLDILLEREVDGVFVLNAAAKTFYQISKRYGLGIPLIGIDTYNEDTLFHKLIPDFTAAIAKVAELLGRRPDFVVIDDYRDKKYVDTIKAATGLDQRDIHAYADERRLRKFLAGRSGQAGCVINEFCAIRFWLSRSAAASSPSVRAVFPSCCRHRCPR
ncbi:LacI family DNA-binding transcriptional regulator [Cohnella faecalis]|uniref:LacI family transcriptional regulator n=1 Tax=Cohnella faecalis TaxID=2315694 RepID=A0A398CCH3_9BACL|nr:LacI family DNA-binding transcriptional regulator [Cohnella faecalis]RIE00886.1 LacI family transcriptional regulator [Cohnella faecalis]